MNRNLEAKLRPFPDSIGENALESADVARNSYPVDSSRKRFIAIATRPGLDSIADPSKWFLLLFSFE